MEEVLGEAAAAPVEVEEVPAAIPEGEEAVPGLPSDEVAFEVPDKFKDKSIEDVIKSYQELEKMGKSPELEGGDLESKLGEEPGEAEKAGEEEQYQKYADSLDKNGSLSTAEYAELEKAGYTKDQVDAEITARAERAEFNKYKAEKTLNDVLEPLGGGQEQFKAVSDWANKAKSEGDMKAFNEALASSPKIAQQALLKGLYAEYTASQGESDTILHTSTPQTAPTKGYTSEADFFRDIGSPDYQTHRSFATAVEAKLAKTNTEGWSIG